MRDFKVLTVCGAGVGTSTLLRMNISAAFKDFDLPYRVKVENTSLSRAKGVPCDLIVTFESFEADVRKFCPNVVAIRNLMDKQELHDKIAAFLAETQPNQER